MANDIHNYRGRLRYVERVTISAIKNNEEVSSSLYRKNPGRVSVHDIYHPHTGESYWEIRR